MRRKMLSLMIMAIFFIPLLSGCWSSRQLNELAIATAIGVDKVGEKYLISIQLINPGEITNVKGATTRAPVTTYRTTGDTIFEAIRRMTKETPRKVYMAHLRIILFGEEFASGQGLLDAIDFFSRDHEYRTDFFIGIAKDAKAHQVLDILTTIEKIPANHIFSALENAQNSFGTSRAVHIDTFLGQSTNEGLSPVLPGIVLAGDYEKGVKKENVNRVKAASNIKMDGLAVLRKDKLVGWLDEQESIGLNFIQSKLENTIVTFPFEGKNISAELMRINGKVKEKIKNNEPIFNIEIGFEGNIADAPVSVDLNDEKTISRIEEKLEAEIKATVENTVQTLQKEIKVDAVGFGDALNKKEPQLWEQLKGDWDEIFKTVSYEVKVDANIRRLGTISNSRMKE